jgi:KilA-N domain
MSKIKVNDTEINILSINNDDFISITDIAKYKTDDSSAVIGNWMRNRNTLEFLGVWETLYNHNFKPIEFEGFKKEAGLNSFTMSPQKWVNATNAFGLKVKSGRYGGTFAHKDIAFKFASWISVEFELYIIKEFQRLKEEEQKKLGWNVQREIAKMNYSIHTNSIKQNLIPKVNAHKISIVYANEADVLNVALFGKTAKEWREENPDLIGNIRDYASIHELICLSNLENLNAVFIAENIVQSERLIKLNQIAIHQISILQNTSTKLLK